MTSTTCDILIIGGGIVGMCTALAINSRCNGNLSIVVADEKAPRECLNEDFDGRASAIAASSFNMLLALGVASRLDGQTQPIRDILISDGVTGQAPSPLTLHFDSQLSGEGGQAMGQMMENRHLRIAMIEQIEACPAITWRAPARLCDHEVSRDGVTASFDQGGTITAKLLIAADGRHSPIRKRSGISISGWDYPQSAIVTTVSHAEPHKGVAHELFLPAGPFAILPLPNDAQNRHRSSIVWTDKARAAKAARALPDDMFEAELARRFGDHWGTVTVCAPRWVYPLNLQMAKSYIAPRTALIGDAAHAIHPIAGQGLNMGLRDAAALADVITQALETGEDIGAETALARYENWRSFDNQALAMATDIFNRLFSNSIAPLQHARRLGMAAIDKVTPARAAFIKEAAGLTGDLPQLLR